MTTKALPPPPLSLVAVILVIVGLVLVLGPRDTGRDATSASPAAPSEAANPSTHSTPDHESDAAEQAELNAQRRAVTAFARAFSSGDPQEVWLDALAPRVTPELLEGFAFTDPALRPTDPPTRITYLAPGGDFQLDFADGHKMVCSVFFGPQGEWLVDSTKPVRPPVPTGNDV